MRQTLAANGTIYVEGDDGLWRKMTVTPTSGGAWASFGPPLTLEEIVGTASGDFVSLLCQTLTDVMDRACVQADDDTPAEGLSDTDVNGDALLRRWTEGPPTDDD